MHTRCQVDDAKRPLESQTARTVLKRLDMFYLMSFWASVTTRHGAEMATTKNMIRGLIGAREHTSGMVGKMQPSALRAWRLSRHFSSITTQSCLRFSMRRPATLTCIIKASSAGPSTTPGARTCDSPQALGNQFGVCLTDRITHWASDINGRSAHDLILNLF